MVPPDAFSDVGLQPPPPPLLAEIEGALLTLTVTVAVLLQPLVLVPLAVYVVVAPGLAVVLLPVVADSPVPGDHV